MNNLLDILRTITARLTRGPRRGVTAVATLLIPALAALAIVAVFGASLDATKDIPVAVVNKDAGATDADGRELAAGDGLVDSLEDSAELAWSVVDEDQASAGLADGTYALILEIPEDYSEKIASLDTSKPEKAQLNIISDGTQNVLATDQGTAVLRQVQSRLRAEMGENYIIGVLNDVNGQASRLKLAADGSVMLDSAYDALEQGTAGIADGLDQMATGADALTSGVDAISDGMRAAGTGAQALAAGMDQTNERLVEPLATGASGIASGAIALGEALEPLGQSLLQQAGELGTYAGDAASVGALATQLQAQQTSLSDALSQMNTASDTVVSAATNMADSASAAQDAAAQVQGQAMVLADALDAESDDSQHPDLLAQLDALTAQYEAELAENGATASDSLVAARDQLRERLAQTAEDADALAVQANTAATEIADLAGERDAVDTAAREYETAASAASDAASAMADTANGITEPAGDMAGGLSSLARGLAINAIGVSASAEGASQVGSAAQLVATGTSTLPQVLGTFSDGTVDIGQGSVVLADALDVVSLGISGLGDGMASLATLQGQLASGVSQLREGQQSISDTLDTAGETLSSLSGNYADRAEVASASVTLATTTRNRVDGDAAVFAPLAIAAALWIGAAISSLIVPMLDKRSVLMGHTVSGTLSSLIALSGIGLVQAFIAVAAVVLLGGAVPAHMPAFLGLTVLASISFGACTQAMHLVFGRAAVPVVLLFLVVQLACAGSILPEALAGGLFVALGKVLPVPVLTEALRGAVSGSLAGAGGAFAVLVVWAVAAFAVSLLAARARTNIRPERVFA